MKISDTIHIHNFRGIQNGTIAGLGDINFFVGQNNSGKSTILEMFGLYCDPEQMLPYILKRRGTKDRTSITFLFHNEKTEMNVQIFDTRRRE